jgi:hypothetical protein
LFETYVGGMPAFSISKEIYKEEYRDFAEIVAVREELMHLALKKWY